MSQLQRHFSNNVTTLIQRRNYNQITTFCRCLLNDLFFETLLKRDMVERPNDLKTTTLQRRHDVVCLPRKVTAKVSG